MRRVSKLQLLLAPVLLAASVGCAVPGRSVGCATGNGCTYTSMDRTNRLMQVAAQYEKEGKPELAYKMYKHLSSQDADNVMAKDRMELIAKGQSEAELDAKVAARTEEFHADAALYLGSGEYNPEYSYEASESERAGIEAQITSEKLANNPVVAREIAQREQAYFAWWDVLAQRDDVTGEIIGYEDFDKDVSYIVYSQERRDAMEANGYTVSEIDALEEAANVRFYDQAEQYAKADFDANYSYTPDADTINDLIEGAHFSTAQLEAAFRRDLILPVLDTQITIEEPNVVGENVIISSARDVGSIIDPMILNAGDTLTTEQRLALFTAERSDITFTNDRVFVGQSDDLDVIARGMLRVDAERHAFVGSEEDVNLLFFRANGDARLKTAGKIARVGNFTDAVRGTDIALEASGGDIGAADLPLRVTVLNGGSLAARAAGDIYLEALKNLMG